MSKVPRSFGAATVVAVCAFAATAAAQTAGPVADGDFTGALAISGGFTANIDGGGASGAVTLLADGQGPLELTLRAGQMTGEWSLSGTETLGGTISGSAGGTTVNIVMDGAGEFAGSGQMSGPPSDYRLAGTVEFSNTTSVNVAGALSQSRTATETVTLNEPLTEVIVLCQDIHGRWDLEIRRDIEEVGFDEFLRGYFSAWTAASL